ncbi:MAG: hypothetical protein RIQ81_1593 [Pseudomonadota bacterium]|jgi:hypothetical protein
MRPVDEKSEKKRRMRPQLPHQAGVTLVEVLVAIGLATTVTLIVAQILVNTLKVQKRADLRTDLQAFVTRINNDLDCGKTFAGITDPNNPTDANCAYLTLKSSSGQNILAPDPSAAGTVFAGSGAITKNWWGMARCDESKQSIVIYVAMKEPGTWNYGKDPVKANNDPSDVIQLQHWNTAPSPIFGGTGKPKLCESYFGSTAGVRNCPSAPYQQYVTGLASGDSVTCAPLPTQNPSVQCPSGQVAVNYDMKTNKPKCRSLDTNDLSSIAGIQSWLKQQVIPNCSDSQVYAADTSSPNTMKCVTTYKAKRCTNGSDYFPATSDSCNGMAGYSPDGGLFDFSVLPAVIP